MNLAWKDIDAVAEVLYNPAMSHVETQAPPPELLVTGHFRELYGYAVHRSHGSGNWLMTYTLAGQGVYRQPGVEARVGPGDLALLRPDALHDYSTPIGEVWEFLWAHFHPRLAWRAWWRWPEVGNGLYVARVSDDATRERVRQALLRMRADAAPIGDLALAPREAGLVARPGLERELALNGLEEALLLVARAASADGARPLDPRVRQALELILADLAQPLDVATLARAVALSPSRLAHLFKRELGESVVQTALRLRLREAARQLEFTSQSVKSVARQTGFQSAFYFSRQFHRHFGVSPLAYRRLRGGA